MATAKATRASYTFCEEIEDHQTGEEMDGEAHLTAACSLTPCLEYNSKYKGIDRQHQ